MSWQALDSAARTLLALGASWTLKATLLLLGAAAIAWLARRGARLRHALWSLAFAAVLALPLLTLVVPALPVAVPTPTQAPTAVGAPWSIGTTFGRTEPSTADTAQHAPARSLDTPSAEPLPGPPSARVPIARIPTSLWLTALWLAGAAAGLGALAVGLCRAMTLIRAAAPADDPAWHAALAGAARRLGIRRAVALRCSDRVAAPMTGGLLHPVLLLPCSAESWSRERLELVLLHELVHVARADTLRLLVARCVLALYWFHPLVWWAARRASLAREQACDETVLDRVAERGLRPSTYARHLLDLAEPARRLLTAPALAERCHLETRIMAILSPSHRRIRPLLASCLVAAAAAWTLTVAALAPRAAAPEMEPLPTPRQSEPARTDVAEPAAERAAGAEAAIERALIGVPPAASFAASALPPTCWLDEVHGKFSGTIHRTREAEGHTLEVFGVTGGSEVVLQTREGDLDLCLRAYGPPAVDSASLVGGPLPEGSWRLLATRDGRGSVELTMTGGAGGGQTRWQVDGAERTLDASGEAWRNALLEVLEKHWRISQLRGEESSLRGKISSIRGEESSLRGEISSIRGHVSSLHGKISSIRGHESSLRGEISSIRGHVSSLRGEISSIRGHESSLRGEVSSLRGKLSSLDSARRATSDADTRTRLESEMSAIESEMRAAEGRVADYDTASRVAEVERQLAAYDAESKIRQVEAKLSAFDSHAQILQVEAELAAYDADARVREVEAEIRDLDVAAKVAAIEREIEELDAPGKVRRIESEMAPAIRRLEAANLAVRR